MRRTKLEQIIEIWIEEQRAVSSVSIAETDTLELVQIDGYVNLLSLTKAVIKAVQEQIEQ